jgi:hypothetical protein
MLTLAGLVRSAISYIVAVEGAHMICIQDFWCLWRAPYVHESGRDLTPNIGVYTRHKIPPTLEEYV